MARYHMQSARQHIQRLFLNLERFCSQQDIICSMCWRLLVVHAKSSITVTGACTQESGLFKLPQKYYTSACNSSHRNQNNPSNQSSRHQTTPAAHPRNHLEPPQQLTTQHKPASVKFPTNNIKNFCGFVVVTVPPTVETLIFHLLIQFCKVKLHVFHVIQQPTCNFCRLFLQKHMKIQIKVK